MSEAFSKMQTIKFDENEMLEYEKDKVSINKSVRKIAGEAKARAKRSTCYICGKPCNSFCNSHTVPQFCLNRIAVNGRIYTSGLQKEFPLIGKDTGVSQASVFHLICNSCDSILFQNYENPDAYCVPPSSKMLSQIAMKNYLRQISKRLEEKELYKILYSKYGNPISKFNTSQCLTTIPLDLMEYENGFLRAKVASSGNHEDWYYLCYYTKLNYVAPIAFQGAITLVSGFNNKIINDIYNFDPNYHTQDIHISIFPIKNETIVFAFIDSRFKRYRPFYRHLRALSFEDQLATINYIVLSNSEDVFIAKTEKIISEVLTDRAFLNVCQTTTNGILDSNKKPNIDNAAESFSLANRNSIPNLLSKEFAL